MEMRTCMACNGMGTKTCPACGGTGFNPNTVLKPEVTGTHIGTRDATHCSQCGGTGLITCENCEGTGQVAEEE